jgi:hypothetical protein
MPVIRLHRTGTPDTCIDEYIYAPTTDFNSTPLPVTIDTDYAATTAGKYAVLYSSNPLTNYDGAVVTLDGGAFLAVSNVTTNPNGDLIWVRGLPYYAIVVTLTTIPATSTIDPNNAFIFAPSSDFKNLPYAITLDLTVINTPGKYAIFYSSRRLTNYVGATVGFSGSTSLQATVTGPGNGEVVSIGDTKYYAVVVTVI